MKSNPVLAIILSIIFAASVYAQCNQTNAISVSTGTAEIIAGIPGTTVSVCGILVNASATSTGVVVQTGTGTTCGTSTVNKSGNIILAQHGVASLGAGSSGDGSTLFTTPTGYAVCVQVTSGTIAGMVSYRQ